MSLDANTPVLVGIGVSQQRLDDPAAAKQAYQLMIDAVQRAAADAGAPALLSDARRIAVPKGMWPYTDPARLIAEGIGASNAQTVLGEIGILQQTLLGDACRAIAEGELDIAIVAGGEAKFRQLRAAITGEELQDDMQQLDATPDITLTPDAELWSEIEADAGLGMPVGYYAIMESALRHAHGESVAAHRDRIAELYAGFSAVAADNPHAWQRQPVDAAAIRDAVGKNKMLAFPYTKLHNSQWNVDQAAALIFCSVGRARALGIDESRWIFPLSSTESNHMVNTAQRPQLQRSPGARIAGEKALALAGVSIDQLSHIDLYSCFPAAVQIYAEELGIDQQRPLTVTGGMTFGGGPLNNYVLQATCRMAECLRTDRDAGQPGVGLVSSVSGMITKQGFGIWSATAGQQGFAFADVTEAVRDQWQALPLQRAESGEATVVGYTVLYNQDQPERAVAVCDLPDGARTVAFSQDAALMQRMMEEDLCGHTVTLNQGQFQLNGATH